MSEYTYSKEMLAVRAQMRKERMIESCMDLIKGIGYLVMMGVGLLALLVAMYYPIYMLAGYQCNQYGDTTGKPTEYKISGCYIQEKGVWYNWEEYKHRFVAQGKMN